LSEIERYGLILIKKSRPQQSKYGNGQIMYVELYDPTEEEIVRTVLKATRQLRMFCLLDLSYSKERQENWQMNNWREISIKSLQTIQIIDEDKAWASFSEDELPPRVYASWNVRFQVVGQHQREFSGFYRFRDCTFYNGYLETPDGLKVSSNQFTPRAPLMGYFNNINDEDNPIKGGFEAKGIADLVMRKVEGVWKAVPRLNGDTQVKMFNYELGDLQEVNKTYLADLAYKALIAWARRKLDDEKKILSKDEIEDKAQELGIEIDGDEFLTEVTFKPEYQKEFFDFFRDLAVETFYSEKAFFFILKNGNIAWEKPEYGASTYIFEGQDLQKLWDYLAETPRSSIVSDDRVQAVLKFIGRRKHPQANESEYTENWKEDIKEKAGLN
jgi:hypothetical protein